MHPTLKWSDFIPTRIHVIFSSRLSMPSCVMPLMIQVIFSFLVLIVSWIKMSMSVELGIVIFKFCS